MEEPTFAPTTPERIARNQVIFREANDRLRDRIESMDGDLGRVPFICECAAPECRELVSLTLEEYARVRKSDRWFFNAVGHEAVAGPSSQTIAATDRYVIAEKVGDAGEYAERFADEGTAA
jgi:hypothetical protein